jgi:dihydroorotate dehydrogenase
VRADESGDQIRFIAAPAYRPASGLSYVSPSTGSFDYRLNSKLRLMGIAYACLRALLFRLDPEKAHELALKAARSGGSGLARIVGGRDVPGLAREVAGLKFGNPVGLAAGFDKNGHALPFWRALGFGFVEFGTVTPRPQPGNPPPRVWRFPKHRAIGNALGFPSDGASMVASRIRRDKLRGDVVGINLGKNKDTPLPRAADDYVAALDLTRSVADYFVVNVSSPNTPGLRDLQTRDYLEELVGRVVAAAAGTPVLVKLSPDLEDRQLADAILACTSAHAAGIVLVNTTLARPEGVCFEGGLSGRPLAGRARQVLAEARRLTKLPLISVGGIDSPEEARARLEGGASLVQVYTGLIYEGPGLVARILKGLRPPAPP